MFDVACGGAEVLRVIKFIWTLLDIVLFIVPMGLIVMVSIDFAKNVIAGREDDMKKNMNVAIKRILFCVVLMLVPTICEFAIGMVDVDTEEKISGFDCINIAITQDDFSQYEIDFKDDENDNGQHVTNGTLTK